MASQLCDDCEHPHAVDPDVCPIDPVDPTEHRHLAEIRRLDRELVLARARIVDLEEATRTMDRECSQKLVHAGEDNEAMAECISVLRARLAVVERERDSWEASCDALRARMLKAAPEAEA
jgi:hypothetical protein